MVSPKDQLISRGSQEISVAVWFKVTIVALPLLKHEVLTLY